MGYEDALRRLFYELNLTPGELANELGVSPETVELWEEGQARPDNASLAALIDYACEHLISEDALSELGKLNAMEDAPTWEDISIRLLDLDYETIATINVKTGEARNYSGGHLQEVISEKKQIIDYVAGVEAYIRKYCIENDVERIISETSLPYAMEQLKSKASYAVIYALREDESIVQKRVVFTYLDEKKTTMLRAVQNIKENYSYEQDLSDQISNALKTLQELGGMNVARYDLKTMTFYSGSEITRSLGYDEVIENVPEKFIESGFVAPSCIDEYRRFFGRLRDGEAGTITAACKVPDGSYHWMRIDARLVYDKNKAPYLAILSCKDIEKEREQATVYKKWRQSFENKDKSSYTLFRCNLSKGASFDKVEGALIKLQFDPAFHTFNERTMEYAGRFVHIDDFSAYTSLLNSENLLAGYYRGKKMASLDYREITGIDEYRWIHLIVELASYPDSADVEAFLMYELATPEQIDGAEVKARIDADSLTGLLNRRAFFEGLKEIIKRQPDKTHALLLVDIDGFNLINENFGHVVGDQALVEAAQALRAIVPEENILGRIGGDEFMICMKDVSGQAIVEQKAMQLLAALRKAFSVEIRMTASIGIAFYPNDGKNTEMLYHNVDRALYAAKAHGRDSFSLYNGELLSTRGADASSASAADSIINKRILVVDDREETISLIKRVLEDEYSIEVCSDEGAAISGLNRYGFSLSLILLSLDLSSVDAFSLLDMIRRIRDANSVPVIAISRMDERSLSLESLRRGANDFIFVPVDPELLRIRVNSAINKTENHRLRAQNASFQTQQKDIHSYRSVYENFGTVVVEGDWLANTFIYDPNISDRIAGRYDERPLWQIFKSDLVADVQDIKAMETLVTDIVGSHTRTSGTIDVMLKTPSNVKHWFTMTAFKRFNDRDQVSKIIITFLDINEDVLASKKLRFLAEHDSLTGLYNRNSFLKLVHEVVSLKPRDAYVMLCANINDFRFINERYGREEGDRLLQYCAERILPLVNSHNGFAGRLSNDNFAMLLPNEPELLERAAMTCQNFFSDYPLKARITGRIGAYVVSDPNMTADAMVDLSFTASDSIKGKFASWLAVYNESMNEKRLRDKSISDRMESALADGQFTVYFQPQFHHATGQIVGAEALARWIDPERGVVPPREFIPVFEKNGFITKLDEYIWDKAAQNISAWIKAGNEPVPISVNVSREDTNDPELCSKLLAIVEKYKIPLSLFRLEITESLFTEDTERLIAVVEQLHNAGFLIEMDDFGSGYSSLNILKDVPVDILKLDMTFFSGRDNLGRGGMIINAVLRMARWLNIPVIAEGVELKAQADFLLSIGCPTIQGFLYEKPMPAGQFESMLLESGNRLMIHQNAVASELDSNSFWDPLSVDSQVFNNYIDAAAIFEYHNGEYEIIRMNRRFINALRIEQSVKLPSRSIVRLNEEDKFKLKKAVLKAAHSGKDVNTEICCILGDGTEQTFCTTLRVVAKSDDRVLLFMSVR